jgi:hypothetical protein
MSGSVKDKDCVSFSVSLGKTGIILSLTWLRRFKREGDKVYIHINLTGVFSGTGSAGQGNVLTLVKLEMRKNNIN